MSDSEKEVLSFEIREELAGAWIDYTRRVKDILDALPDETLTAFAGQISQEDIDKVFGYRILLERMEAESTVNMRWHFKRAEEAEKAGGSGFYCLFHGEDMLVCGHLHDPCKCNDEGES